jgi:hypothetical protein
MSASEQSGRGGGGDELGRAVLIVPRAEVRRLAPIAPVHIQSPALANHTCQQKAQRPPGGM